MTGPSPSGATPSFELATLGGGCFWCLEAVFQQVRGVEEVTSGYSGGSVANPSYEAVCTGRTGHAEVVQLRFDPRTISYPDLLRIFFSIHDPTTLNRQGGDVGTQYRSVILTRGPEQARVAKEVIREFTEAGVFSRPIVTEVVPFVAFYPAEEYHRDYFRRNPGKAYCRMVIEPKVLKFRKQFLDRLMAPPA
jgi:peptide-methionine (S)-S-oxide reductase